MADLKTVDSDGKINGSGNSWDDIVRVQIAGLAGKYTNNQKVNAVLAKWHDDITLGIKHHKNFSPHVNGFYSIFMVHGTWYQKYLEHVSGLSDAEYNLVKESPPTISASPKTLLDTSRSFNMLATDIDVPDITQEYISVSSRLRNVFVPSRNYFVSDFSISYIENVNLEVIRYHEAWFKYLDLLKRGEIKMYKDATECEAANSRDIFLDMPFTNAVWIVVYQPFTTNIQLLIKLIGVMPVTMPLKQVVGNRSASKLTVLNMQYKAADMFYKFYNDSQSMWDDTDILSESFKAEILNPLTDRIT